MGIFARISIKSFLTALIAILIVSLTIQSVINVANTYEESKKIELVNMANKISDLVLTASGYQAKERGNTATALSSGGAADPVIMQNIKDTRSNGDELIKAAYALADELVKKDSGSTFPAALKKALEKYSALEAGRIRVDERFNGGNESLSAGEWIETATSLIEANAELRFAAISASSSREPLMEAVRLNLELKQAVWLVSEYAGRERAIISGFVTTGKPMDDKTVEKLNTFRAIVELNIKPILRLKESGVNEEIKDSIDKMEKVFLGSFSEVRRSIYDSAKTGEYPMSGRDWIARSTEAIDTTLQVSAAVGKLVNDGYADMSAAKVKMAASIAVLALIICLGAGSILIIKKKVLSPMGYLKDAMLGIENTGDLGMKIEVKSDDENGQMAKTFNSMIGKFHDVIKEIRSSTDQLASASEELTSSAVLIANGSQAQGSKAAQVSVAAQEMSATIIEVTRNVGGAASAAREARDVAEKGGEIVARTIDSMDGISKTAKESSFIITNLGERSKEIGNIVNVIDDIADQTNLLALNAAIEAARAGEQGRGFAVVADEVRKLAEKTMKATKEIGAMIKAMQNETGRAITSMESEVVAVNSGAALAKAAGDSLREIVAKVGVVTSMIEQISTASEQQSAATEQISGDMETVASVITETSASSRQIADASQEIAELASRLKDKIEIFKIGRENEKGPENLINLRNYSVAV